MHVQPTAIARLRAVEVSPALFRKLALAAVAWLFVVVATGAIVRLTASGLGCDNWPRCGSAPFPTDAKGGHAVIEFSNRVIALLTMGFTLVAWLAARRTPGLPRWVARLALAVFVGTVAQIPLGGLTVIFDLHPLLVMSHFLLAFAMLGLAVVVANEARAHEIGHVAPLVPLPLRRLGLLLASVCLALVTTGSFVTAAGPHSGGADIRRLYTVEGTLYVHVRLTAAFGILFALALAALVLRWRLAPRLALAALVLLGLLLAQMAIGEIQYREGLPWWLVLLHVSAAAAVWAWTAALVTSFWRPLSSLAPRA